MNKTCRGCNNELDNCTCNVLTTDRPESLEAKVLRDEIKNLRLINESHQKLNGKLRERIKELELQLANIRTMKEGTDTIEIYDGKEKITYVRAENLITEEEALIVQDHIDSDYMGYSKRYDESSLDFKLLEGRKKTFEEYLEYTGQDKLLAKLQKIIDKKG